MVANMVVLVGGNIIGILLHTMMEHAQRKAFLDTRNCIAARLEMEDENEKLVRRMKQDEEYCGGDTESFSIVNFFFFFYNSFAI